MKLPNTLASFDIQRYLNDWRGISETDTVPFVGHTVEVLWVDENNNIRPSFGEPNTKYAVALGTPVWPIYVRISNGWDLDVTLGEITKETKHEWIIEAGMYDYGKYVCVIFGEQAEDKENDRITTGFFVLKSALYISSERKGDRARNGKRIAKRIEVQSSSNKSKKYEVLYYEDATASCNCHSWIFSKMVPKTCKHCKKVMADILTGNPTP